MLVLFWFVAHIHTTIIFPPDVMKAPHKYACIDSAQTTTRLLELFQKLRELGHPKYSQSGFHNEILCSMSIDCATAKVQYC